MSAIANGLSLILAKFGAVLTWIGQLVIAAFTAFVLMAKDLFCWALDSLLKLAVSILGTFDFAGFATFAGALAGVPASTIEMMQAIGVSTALGMVVTALGIRFALQLIPFVRFGS